MPHVCMFSERLYSQLPINNKRIHPFVSIATTKSSNLMQAVKNANISPSWKHQILHSYQSSICLIKIICSATVMTLKITNF